MLRRLSIALVMSCSFLNLFCQSNHPFRSVDVEEFERAVSDSTYVVLDVRTPEEYAEGHIVGTHLNIDVLDANFKQEALAKLPKDRSVALYCRSGNRSKSAARVLSESGYNVVELASGYRGWAAAGKPVAR